MARLNLARGARTGASAYNRAHARTCVAVLVYTPKWRAALHLTWWHCAVLGLATQSRCYVIGRDGVNNIAARAIDTDEFSTRIHHVFAKWKN